MPRPVTSPLELAQADDGAQALPASGFTRIFAGPDGRLYRKDPSGRAKVLDADQEQLWLALGQMRCALTMMGLDPATIDPMDALEAMS